MRTTVRVLAAVIMAGLLVTGLAMMAYGRWSRPIADGDQALAEGQWDRALAAYAEAEGRFDRLPFLKELMAGDYSRVVESQLAILYRLQRHDDVIERADQSTERAFPHYWAGLALFAKGRAEEKAEARLQWFSRAEDELRRAVQAAPANWDAKYDFELVLRLAAELRKQPKTPPNQLMQLLRPQPKSSAKPAQRVG